MRESIWLKNGGPDDESNSTTFDFGKSWIKFYIVVGLVVAFSYVQSLSLFLLFNRKTFAVVVDRTSDDECLWSSRQDHLTTTV